MRKTFNLGIGYCLVVPPDVTIDNMEWWTIGEVVVQQEKVIYCYVHLQ